MEDSMVWMALSGCFLVPGPSCGPGTEKLDGQCVPEASDNPDATGGLPGEPVDTGVPAADPSGPTILSVSSNITRMTEGDRLTITAIVTDPDGIDDLIGGELKGTGGVTYGAFATSAQEGAYAIELWWEDLDTVQAIEFDGSAERPMTIWFYDVAGHVATEAFDLELYCAGGSACDGLCVDTDDDPDNCGQCGHTCSADFDDACQQSQCVEYSDCTTQGGQTCDELCASSGLGSCVQARWYGQPGAGLAHDDGTCGGYREMLTSCSARLFTQQEADGYTCFCLE